MTGTGHRIGSHSARNVKLLVVLAVVALFWAMLIVELITIL